MLKPSARIFPLGTVLEGETPDYNPNNFYIDGIWEQTQEGMVAVGLDASQTEFDEIGKTGGSKLLQSHNHTVNIGAKNNAWQAPNFVINYQYQSQSVLVSSGIVNNAGGGDSGNLQPYKVVYKWKLISYSN